MTIRRALELEISDLEAQHAEAQADNHYKAARYIAEQLTRKRRQLADLNRERAAQIAAAAIAIAHLEAVNASL